MDQATLGTRLAKFSLRVLRLVAIAYLVVLLVMTFLERSLVYPAPPIAWGNWDQAGEDFEEVWIEVPPAGSAEKATRVHGWFFDREAADHAILYCHGNGEDVSGQPELARLLRDELNAAVLVFDYRGYGKSDGVPDEPGVVADGLAAQRWLAERTGRTPEETIVIGRSLGGGVATAIAAEQGAEALILQSTFSRITDAAGARYPWLPVSWLMKNRYDSIKRVKAYGGPVLVSHGDRDEIIPFAHGEALHAAATGHKRFITLPGRTHNQPQPRDYYPQLRAFLAGVTEL